MPKARLPVPDDILARDGLCACGCGKATPLAVKTEARAGNYTGYPCRWAYGHGRSGAGRVITKSGYVKVFKPTHPNADVTGYVMEHRFVMAEDLRRPLREHETVHHVNGKRGDNRLSNLQLRIGNHGKGAVLVCADCGGANIEGRPLAEVEAA